jgi:DEP domain-containing protein 5
MSRHVAGANPPSLSRKGPAWSAHLRQFSRSSLDRASFEPPRSPADTVSSASTVRGDGQSAVRRGRLERRCAVTVNEGYSTDEVLLNLDLFPEFKPGSLVAATVLRPDGDKASAAHGGHKGEGSAGTKEGDAQGRKYIFVVKDLSKELKIRHPGLEIYVVKHIADVFGMKKGVNILLAPVSRVSSHRFARRTLMHRPGRREQSCRRGRTR